MKLYDGRGPNPQTVRVFILERGVTLDVQPIDAGNQEHRRPPFTTEINTKGEIPALMADDGTVITEITAIMEYLDEVSDGPSLIGSSPEERANTRRWTRRVYLGICHPATEWWRGTPDAEAFYRGQRVLMPEGQRSFRLQTDVGLNLMESDLEGRDLIAGDSFSMADCMLFGFMDSALNGWADWLNPPARPNIAAWYDRMLARPKCVAARKLFATGPLELPA